MLSNSISLFHSLNHNNLVSVNGSVLAKIKPMVTLEEVEKHDFDPNLNIFYLGHEIDVQEEPPKGLQNMLEHHERIKPKVSES